MLGENLGACTFEELQQLERQLEKSVNIIRTRKVHSKYYWHIFSYAHVFIHAYVSVDVQNQVFKEQIDLLKEKVITAARCMSM